MGKKIDPQQLILNLCKPDELSFENFYCPNTNENISNTNQNIVNFLKNFTEIPLSNLMQFAYLWGENGSGRTHLLMACCALHREKNLSAIYVPLKDIKNSAPTILENLENLSLICFDDLDEIVNDASWEEAMFHCFNRLQQQQRHIIISANATPSALSFQLPDLRSRMNSGIIHKLNPLTDEQKIAALQFRAEKLGLELPNSTAIFLLNHCSRDTTTLFALLRKLDLASLQAQRFLTIPFVKQILGATE